MCVTARFVAHFFIITTVTISKCDLAEIRFTYIRCRAIDASIINIPLCITKPISRNVTETSLRVRLARSVSNIVTRVRFMKKSSDYSLYFGEKSYDACKFLSNRKIYPIADYLFNIIDDYTNLNHSCPYKVGFGVGFKGDIIIDRFRIRNDRLTWLFMPEGEYALFTSWNIDGKLRAELNFYFSYK